MSQMQCDNCRSYKFRSYTNVYVHNETGKTKDAEGMIDALLTLVVIFPAMACGVIGLIGVIPSFAVGDAGGIAASLFCLLIGIPAAIRFFKGKKTPLGYTEYERLECEVCGKQFRRKVTAK
jgi:hypothetical protein